jgi:perosamine synthetase
MHIQPSLITYGCNPHGNYENSVYLSENGFYLPSSSGLKKEEIEHICNLIKDFRNIF